MLSDVNLTDKYQPFEPPILWRTILGECGTEKMGHFSEDALIKTLDASLGMIPCAANAYPKRISYFLLLFSLSNDQMVIALVQSQSRVLSTHIV